MSSQPQQQNQPPSPQTRILLPNGTQIIHHITAPSKSAFPPSLDIPGTIQTFNLGNRNDPLHTPSFSGSTGILRFTTENRMPRHVHISTVSAETNTNTNNDTHPDKTTNHIARYIVEKILVLDGVALAELGSSEIYVIPPMTLVIIAPGVPHSWVACPPGIDFQNLLELDDCHVSDDHTDHGDEKKVISTGRFTAFFEYEEPTGFYPTKQTEKLSSLGDYVRCGEEELQGIRFPRMNVEDVVRKGRFVWGGKVVQLG